MERAYRSLTSEDKYRVESFDCPILEDSRQSLVVSQDSDSRSERLDVIVNEVLIGDNRWFSQELIFYIFKHY